MSAPRLGRLVAAQRQHQRLVLLGFAAFFSLLPLSAAQRAVARLVQGPTLEDCSTFDDVWHPQACAEFYRPIDLRLLAVVAGGLALGTLIVFAIDRAIARRAARLERLFAEEAATITWAYPIALRVTAAGVPVTTVRVLLLRTLSGEELRLRVREDELKAAIEELAALAPGASLGHQPELDRSRLT